MIVGIGASAGGLDAFKSFFAATPADSGMAFVLVQHLSPDHKSMLAELLGRSTIMTVIEAADGVKVKPDCVFVIPPDATMTISGGVLKIVKPAPPRNLRRPIDTFFASLAEDQGENAIGIILSGTGSDGALGMTAIKEQGGLTLAQAEYDSHALPGMPQSAAATGQVDDVLAVEAMPTKLIAYRDHLSEVADSKSDGIRTDASSHLQTIMGALRARSGHDFSNYKEKTLLRRLQRRMQMLQTSTPADYIAHFRKQPEELDRLFRELLIGVTQFFRDPAAFDALNATVLTELVNAKGADETIRVWVPGCATGEEVYTIAILLREAMNARRPRIKVQIFGTDIDDRAITTARHGRYRSPIAGVSEPRLDRWFKEEGEFCCINPEIREMCIFSTHSVIKDPPFSKLDLVSCRNLLIYIEPVMQDQVMRTFHYALNPTGHLFLGTSESVTRTNRLFGSVDKKHRIFNRRDTAEASSVNFRSRGAEAAGSKVPEPGKTVSNDRIDKDSRRVMEKYHPPHVVIDAHQQIVRFSGSAIGTYFEPAAGAPSFALFDMLRKPLRQAVRLVLQDAQNTKAAVRRANVPHHINGQPHIITLIAEPMGQSRGDPGWLVLAFQDGGPVPSDESPAHPGNAETDAALALQQDLLTTRTQLHFTIDELEVANEEMKSANEEYQSVNEELQSSNEELETAKEEMQSVNEELHTINVEMAGKNVMLTRLNSDIKNLLESTEIATLFIDEHLRIKSFTRGLTEIFSVRDTDIGRPITEIVSLLDYADLKRDVTTVLRKLSMTERRVSLKDAAMAFDLRIRPYRTIDNVIDGVVCTFIDVTQKEASDRALRQSESEFHLLAESIPQLAWIMDGGGDIFWYNQRWYDYTGTTLDEMKGWGWKAVHDPGEVERVVKHLKYCIAAGQVWEDTFPLRGIDGQYRRFLSRAHPFHDEAGNIVRWFGTNTDVEDSLRQEEMRELLLKEMDHRIKNLFAMVGGVVSLTGATAKSAKEMTATVQGRLDALASAHSLIRANSPTSHTRTASTLDVLIRKILAPHVDFDTAGTRCRATLDGPEIVIAGDAVTALALILHELATNAVKYGALSVREGRLHVSWAKERNMLALSWQESGGPPIAGPPEHTGFGTQLARTSATGQLGGEFVQDWAATGLTVNLRVSLERLSP